VLQAQTALKKENIYELKNINKMNSLNFDLLLFPNYYLRLDLDLKGILSFSAFYCIWIFGAFHFVVNFEFLSLIWRIR
jgi:hypothetical protein